MNYSNEENINTFQNNNRSLRPLNNNNSNETITKRKKKENNNPEIIEFKSQDNLVFVKNPRPIQNIKPYMATDKTKKQKQLYDSSNNYININKENQVTQQNKSNSSVKINTKVNSKKYFAKNNSKKINNQNINEMIDPNQIQIEKFKIPSNLKKTFIVTTILAGLGLILIILGFINEIASSTPGGGIMFWVLGGVVMIPGGYYSYQFFKAYRAKNEYVRNDILENIPVL
jgi:hypothetical protein